jgi:uncharacterized phage-associated protein
MASVFDVAAYIIGERGAMSAMKLQKLVYYCQAWSLVWDEQPLFPERIEAWVYGTVVPDLYSHHRGQTQVTSVSGNPDTLTQDERDTVDAVLRSYGDKPSWWLTDLTHMEKPWQDARARCEDDAICHTEITKAAMLDYYSGLF